MIILRNNKRQNWEFSSFVDLGVGGGYLLDPPADGRINGRVPRSGIHTPPGRRLHNREKQGGYPQLHRPARHPGQHQVQRRMGPPKVRAQWEPRGPSHPDTLHRRRNHHYTQPGKQEEEQEHTTWISVCLSTSPRFVCLSVYLIIHSGSFWFFAYLSTCLPTVYLPVD